MALPPEPLAELLADADAVVVAEVVEVIEEGAPPPSPPRPAGAKPTFKGRPPVEETLKGEAEAELVVDKPEGPYLLHAGVRGPFFLRRGGIVGRYGPDTYRRAEIVAALG